MTVLWLVGTIVKNFTTMGPKFSGGGGGAAAWDFFPSITIFFSLIAPLGTTPTKQCGQCKDCRECLYQSQQITRKEAQIVCLQEGGMKVDERKQMCPSGLCLEGVCQQAPRQ